MEVEDVHDVNDIVSSQLLVGATVGLSIAGGAYGAGNHIWSFTPLDLTQVFKVSHLFLILLHRDPPQKNCKPSASLNSKLILTA